MQITFLFDEFEKLKQKEMLKSYSNFTHDRLYKQFI